MHSSQSLSNPFELSHWHAEPPEWSITDGILRAVSADHTDFWQRTHYGFQRDDGHALLAPTPGEFSITVTIDAVCEALYDQAGLMLRLDSKHWIKFGIESTDGATHLSCVVTNDLSDWSARPLGVIGPVTLRVTRLGDALLLQNEAPFGSGQWQMARLAPLPRVPRLPLLSGPYLCSPERAGFAARFSGYRVSEPLQRSLHD